MPQQENSRLKNFKNNGRGQEEMRRRRQEVNVELRKQKKDEQFLKRRNVAEDDGEPLSPLQENNPAFNFSPSEVMEQINSNDGQLQIQATQKVRKILSRERKPPIDAVIESGIVPKLVEFLKAENNSILQFEAAWALTNISSGTTVQTMSVVNADAVPAFVRLLSSPFENVAEQAVWALGNIAGDGPNLRDYVIQTGAIGPLLHLITANSSPSLFRNVTWTISNFCRGKTPPPPPEVARDCLPILAQLVRCDDLTVLTDACWALSYVTDTSEDFVTAVMETGVIPSIVALLCHQNVTVVTPALRTLGNIATGNDIQTQAIIDANAVPLLGQLLDYPKTNIQKEAAWTLSNITAGNQQQIQTIFDCDLMPRLVKLLEHSDFRVQKEVTWVVTNITSGGSDAQILELVNYQILPPYCALLVAKDTKVIQLVMDGLAHILEVAKKCNESDRICLMIEECGGLDHIENLQNHDNGDVYNQALQMIEKYFGGEDGNDDPNIAPPGTENGFDFSSVALPDTGFNI